MVLEVVHWYVLAMVCYGIVLFAGLLPVLLLRGTDLLAAAVGKYACVAGYCYVLAASWYVLLVYLLYAWVLVHVVVFMYGLVERLFVLGYGTMVGLLQYAWSDVLVVLLMAKYVCVLGTVLVVWQDVVVEQG